MLNSWRKLKGLPVAATLEAALKDAKPDSGGADQDAPGIAPDVLLNETAAITADIDAQGLFQVQPGSSVAEANHSR